MCKGFSSSEFNEITNSSQEGIFRRDSRMLKQDFKYFKLFQIYIFLPK